MKKKELIKLYLSDLNNIVPQSPARDNRIAMLKEELLVIKDKHSCGKDYATCPAWESFTNGCSDCNKYYKNKR